MNAVRSLPGCRFLNHGDVSSLCRRGRPASAAPMRPRRLRGCRSRPSTDVHHVSHLVLMTLLPALADGDLEQFGRALTEVQEVTGQWFASAQGGTFASGPSRALVRQLAEWGATGVGQSSWGPTRLWHRRWRRGGGATRRSCARGARIGRSGVRGTVSIRRRSRVAAVDGVQSAVADARYHVRIARLEAT